MNVVSLSQNILLYSTHPACDYVNQMIKCLGDKIKWGEPSEHCDIALGYYWLADNESEGESSCYLWTISGIFHLIFSYHDWLRVTKTSESEPSDNRGRSG